MKPFWIARLAVVLIAISFSRRSADAQGAIEISPPSGTIGSEIVISGSGFGTELGLVYVGGVRLKLTEWTNTRIVGLLKKAPPPGDLPVRIVYRRPLDPSIPEVTAPQLFTVSAPHRGAFVSCENALRFCLQGDFFGTRKGKILIRFEFEKNGQRILRSARSKVRRWTMDPQSGSSEVVFDLPRQLPPGIHDVLLVNKLGEFPMGRILVGIVEEADLAPAPRPGTEGRTDSERFCDLNRQTGQLIVRVRNQGRGDAPPAAVRVEFSLRDGSLSRSVLTGPISAGETVEVLFDIPAGCFNADCGFKIFVDDENDVPETDEENNTAAGSCLG